MISVHIERDKHSKAQTITLR